MSREIKFRAWDENFGKMLFAEEFELLNEVDNNIHSGYYADNGEWYSRQLMQYTGLKDKNGVEIYEGDIVKFIYGKELISAVMHSNMFGYEVANKDGIILGLILVNGFCEVIGNIYENGDLLK